MIYAVKINGEWIAKTPRQFRAERNASIPNAQLEAEGLFLVADDPRPDAGGRLGPIIERDSRPVREWTVVPPSVQDVAAERESRLALGFDYDFGDFRGVHRIGTTEQDMEGWAEVTQWSSAMIALGTPDDSTMIATDSGTANVTALEWQSVLSEASAFRQPIWAASFALQTMDPIPSDYADDKHWP